MFPNSATLALFSATLTEAGQFKCVNVTVRFDMALLLFSKAQTPEHCADSRGGDDNQPTT